jgi:alkanesulfonate monooxygenase SsuD/methylene tetrahydromethanopterin reductase-like flavin-dependent oxidoreductase (luciferase family)
VLCVSPPLRFAVFGVIRQSLGSGGSGGKNPMKSPQETPAVSSSQSAHKLIGTSVDGWLSFNWSLKHMRERELHQITENVPFEILP